MSDRVDAVTAAISAAGGHAICAYLTAGYPGLDDFPGILDDVAAVADVVEVGVPFTDPMADGQTIQKASHQALLAGVNLDYVFDALDDAEADPDVVVTVIAADGPAFSSGGNIKDMAAREGMFSGAPAEMTERYRDTIQQLTRFLATTDLVTIASVNGPAVGAGFDLVLGCDLRIGSRNARFAHTFIEMGIIPAMAARGCYPGSSVGNVPPSSR